MDTPLLSAALQVGLGGALVFRRTWGLFSGELGNPGNLFRRDSIICMANFFQDLRYAFRTLRKAPLFASVAVLSLALGIGANTAIFTLINQLILQLLPVRTPNNWCCSPRAATIMAAIPAQRPLLSHVPGFPRQEPGVPRDVLPHRQCLQRQLRGPNRTGSAELVSGNYFPVLGVGAALGRVFTASDDLIQGGHPLAVLSYGYWKTRFAGDPAVIGKKIVLNGYPLTIVGVSRTGLQWRGARLLAADPRAHDDEGPPPPAFYRSQQPAPPLRAGLRPAQAGSDNRASQSRIAAAVPPDPADGSAGERIRPRHRTYQAAFPQNVDGRAACGQRTLRVARAVFQSAARSDGDRRPGAVDRLLQCGQPVDRARLRPAEGDCRPACAGRGPAAASYCNCWRRASSSLLSAACRASDLRSRWIRR